MKLRKRFPKAALILCLMTLVGSLLAGPAGAASPWVLSAPYEGVSTQSWCNGPYTWTSGIRFQGGNIDADSSTEPDATTGATSWSMSAETWPETVSPGYATLYCGDIATFDAGSFEIHSPAKRSLQIEAKFRIDALSANQEDVVQAEDWDQIDALVKGYIVAAAPCARVEYGGDNSPATLLDTESSAPSVGGIVTASATLHVGEYCPTGTGFRGMVDVDVNVDAAWTVTSSMSGWRRSSLDLDVTLLEVGLTDLS